MMSDRGFVPEGQFGPPGGDLSSLIQRTRDQVATYLGQARTRQRRLLNVAIVAGALATALAGAPAIFADGPPPLWRALCILAAACSLVAAIVTQLQKSNSVGENVSRAETIRARLEVLNIGLISGRLSQEQAATEYAACVEQSSFI
jgi:hypothetical protein